MKKIPNKNEIAELRDNNLKRSLIVNKGLTELKELHKHQADNDQIIHIEIYNMINNNREVLRKFISKKVESAKYANDDIRKFYEGLLEELGSKGKTEKKASDGEKEPLECHSEMMGVDSSGDHSKPPEASETEKKERAFFKNQHEYIEMAKECLEGEKKEMKYIEKDIKDFKLDEPIVFTNPKFDVPKHLKASEGEKKSDETTVVDGFVRETRLGDDSKPEPRACFECSFFGKNGEHLKSGKAHFPSLCEKDLLFFNCKGKQGELIKKGAKLD